MNQLTINTIKTKSEVIKMTTSTHSLIITGNVQDLGFRSIVEHIGRSFGIPGMVFNAKDGSVKILCSGEDSVIDNFTQTIKVRGKENGAEIAYIREQTLSINIELPEPFSKASSDDDFDVGRKLDKANILLKTGFENINSNLNNLNTNFSNLNTDLNIGFENINSNLNNLRSDLNTGFNNLHKDFSRLEAVLERLATK